MKYFHDSKLHFIVDSLKPRSQMPFRTATNAVRTIFRQWKFGKTMEKQGDSYEIIVRTNPCDRNFILGIECVLNHAELACLPLFR